MEQTKRVVGTTFLRSLVLGSTTAIVYFAFEFFFVTLAGAHIRIEYMLLAFGAYLGIGLVLGTVIGLGVGWRTDRKTSGEVSISLSFYHIFGFLALFGFYLFFQHPLVSMRLTFLQKSAASFLTAVFLFALAWWLAKKPIPRKMPFRATCASYGVGITVVCELVAGGRYLNEEYLPLFFGSQSILINMFVLCAAAAIFFIGNMYATGRITPAGGKDMGAALIPASVALVFLVTTAYHPLEKYEMRIRPVKREAAPTERPNVILISIDTIRRDHLSVYGYERETSPNLDAFATDAEIYENAISNSCWTLPSHASMLTGLHTSAHGAHVVTDAFEGLSKADSSRIPSFVGAAPLHPEFVTLTEILRENGYATGAIVGNCTYLYRAFGLNQGFDYYNDLEGMRIKFPPVFEPFRVRFFTEFLSHRFKWYRDAEEVNEIVFAWIHANRRWPFFLFLNYNDPHSPYSAPPPYNRLFPGKISSRALNESEIVRALRAMERELTREEREHFLSQYDGEINYMDHHLGRLFSYLKETNIYENSLIIVVGDHGEAFGEHLALGHRHSLYEPEVRIPLLVKHPEAASKGRRVEAAQPIDILPTALHIVGVPLPAGLDGRSLGSAEADQTLPMSEYYVFQDGVAMSRARVNRCIRTIYDGRYKYIWNSDAPDELYDLKADPEEKNNLATQLPDIAETWRTNLEERLGPPRFRPQQRTGVADKEALDRLKAVGYIE